MNIDWDYHLRTAYQVALESPDPSTQNGAVLVDEDGTLRAVGCNEFPMGVKYTEERWVRPLKYQIIEHAERNSIYRAANNGIMTAGLTMICPWSACSDCARAIIQSGVRRLVRHQEASDRSPDRWLEEIAVADTMLNEAGIEVISISATLGCQPLLHSGETWTP